MLLLLLMCTSAASVHLGQGGVVDNSNDNHNDNSTSNKYCNVDNYKSDNNNAPGGDWLTKPRLHEAKQTAIVKTASLHLG